MKLKPLQLVILIVGGIAAVASSAYMLSGGSEVKLDHRVMLVDVTTGQLFEASTSRHPVSDPAPSPDTGQVQLVGVYKDESGKWYVPKRSKALLKDMDVDSKAIDPETGEVLTPSKDIRAYERK